MERGTDKRWAVVAGIVLLVGVSVAVVVLDPGFGDRGWVAIDLPEPGGSQIESGGELVIAGRAHRSGGCVVNGAGVGLPINGERFSGTLTVPEERGDRLVWFDTVCDGSVRERVARELRPALGVQGRVEIAAVRLNSEALEGLSSEIPGVLNPALATWLDRKVREPGSELRPGATLEVQSAAVRMEDDKLLLDLVADLDLHQTGFAGVHLKSTGQRFVGTIAIRDDRAVIETVRLSGSLCEAYAEMPLVGILAGAACGFLQDFLQPEIEHGLQQVLNEQAEAWAGSVDRRRLVGDAIVDWLEHMSIGERLEQRFEGADLDVDRGRTAGRELSFVVTADASWLGTPGSRAPLEVEDTSSPIDIGVATVLVNRMLGIAFDRPPARVARDLRALGTALGWSGQVGRIEAQFVELANPQATSEPGTLAAFLKEVGLRWNPDGRLVPKVSVPDDGTVAAYVSQATLMRSLYETEGTIAGLSVEGRVTFGGGSGGRDVRLDRRFLFDHLTLEPLSSDGGSIGTESRTRHAALAQLVREEVSGGASGPGWDAFHQFLGAVHELPAHFDFGEMRLEVERLDARAETQILVFSGRLAPRSQ